MTIAVDLGRKATKQTYIQACIILTVLKCYNVDIALHAINSLHISVLC